MALPKCSVWVDGQNLGWMTLGRKFFTSPAGGHNPQFLGRYGQRACEWRIRHCDQVTDLTFLTTLLDYAYPSLQDPQASRSCLRRPRSCRKAPQASGWSWSRWWSASSPVCTQYISLWDTLIIGLEIVPISISTILVTSVKLVCAISISPATNSGDRSSTSTSSGVWCPQRRRRA